MTMTNLVTDTGSEDGGREAALELPSDWGVEAKAGRMYLLKVAIQNVSPSQVQYMWASGRKEKMSDDNSSSVHNQNTHLVICRRGRCARRKCRTGSCHFTWDSFAMSSSGRFKVILTPTILPRTRPRGTRGRETRRRRGSEFSIKVNPSECPAT